MKTIATIFALSLVGLSSLIACGGNLFSGGTPLKGSGNVITISRPLSGFTGIDAGGAVEVIVTAQEDFKVEVEADDNVVEHIVTTISDGILRIHMEDEYSYSETTVRIRVSMPDIKLLDISGASNAKVAKVKSDDLVIGVSGASKVTMEGSSKRLVGEVSGASSLSAEKLSAENVMIEASGASNGYVTATQSLTAEASGASTIYYSGTPKNLTEETSGASSIKRR
jgi:hypothetical protein